MSAPIHHQGLYAAVPAQQMQPAGFGAPPPQQFGAPQLQQQQQQQFGAPLQMPFGAPVPGYAPQPAQMMPQQAAPPPVPAPALFAGADARMEKLKRLAAQFEIRPDFVPRLRKLENFGIVMLCDDSGSMNTAVDAPAHSAADPYGRVRTRWIEMCETASVVCELGTALNDGGVDVYFLNRPPALGVTSAAQLQQVFGYAPPQGYTPLTSRFNFVLQQKREVLRERNLLVLIATDGEPTDDAGGKDIASFLRAIKARPNTCFVQIMACTDVEADIAWMKRLDEETKGIDLIDDFRSEREAVLRAQGKDFSFTYGDYVVKALLGPTDEYFDKLTEVPPGCCAVA